MLFIMKGGIAAAAIAAMATGANAINHRHAHEVFHNKRVVESGETCGCTTIWETITGEPTRKCCAEFEETRWISEIVSDASQFTA